VPSRRRLLAALSAGAAGLAGCVGFDDAVPDTKEPETVTPRDPKPLDVTGAWPRRRNDPAATGITDVTGVADATTYWQLRRLESGPAVVAGDRLFHLAELSERPERRTVTATMEEDATYIQRSGVPHLVARDAATGERRWIQQLDGPAAGWPAVADGTVVAGVNGHLLAADAESGNVRWEQDLGDRVVRDPTIADATVYVPTNESIRAYVLADGTRRWETSVSEWTDGVAVAGDTVYATTTEGDAYALDAATGTERWRVDTVGEAAHPPTVAGDTLFVGGSAGEGAAHAIADGSVRWERTVGPNGWGGGAVHALARSDGSERWRHDTGGEGAVVLPSVADGTVYAGTRGPYEPSLFALGLRAGEEEWSVSLPRTTVEGDIVDGGLAAPPAVVDGAVYAYAVDGLYAIGPG
jgi:outer membrane protein assembly factor BamB